MTNYEEISRENRERYGTDIGRIGHMLLADRYDDRTHFIFELLQNAEDALGRRGTEDGPRQVSFFLSQHELTLSHFGRPFDEADVRGVCGIAESTKDTLSIGRFGIGFKSVYTFTGRPEIHSGGQDFAVENYVLPVRVDRTERKDGETRIVLPLKPDDEDAEEEITDGFKRIGASALLFLRHIDQISWNVQGSAYGLYLRSDPKSLAANVQQIKLIGQESGEPDVDEDWLVFHRDVLSPANEKVGRVELAFSLQPIKDKPKEWVVQPVKSSPLVVFFPTAVETNLGFLVQGPYKTTPSRDNIPRFDLWNRHLVGQTAELLVEAMRWLRDKKMLDISALRCLPLDSEKFPKGSLFEPLFTATRQALLKESLLPSFDGGYAPASCSRLARTQELRELLSPPQLAQLFDTDHATWLTGEITQDRAPEVRQYVMRELKVPEVTPESIVPRLTRDFLEAQSDDWIERLYQFLSAQTALRQRLDKVPLVRLSDGSHVVTHDEGRPLAFLPCDVVTSFPTVRKTVCNTPEARLFLISLGIVEPDLVDDVVFNVLQKYDGDEIDVDADQYTKDIDRILAAFRTDSNNQRVKLLDALRATAFVRVVDASDGKGYLEKPGHVYLATDRLKQLFDGVPGVKIVDDTYPCLKGEDVRNLLEACGALRCPRPIPAPFEPHWSDRLMELRIRAGHSHTSGRGDKVTDFILQGFEELLSVLQTLPAEQRANRARLLWESLGDLEERRGRGVFEGSYEWTSYGNYKTTFASAFVRRLNEVEWVPDENGALRLPHLVTFESLGWKQNPFLQSKIDFKPPILDQLAREAGIDPAALDLLRQYGITSVDDLASRLGITGTQQETDTQPRAELEDAEGQGETDVYEDVKDLYGDDMPDIPPGSFDHDGEDAGRQGRAGNGAGMGKAGAGTGGGRRDGNGAADGLTQTRGEGGSKGGSGPGKRSTGSSGSRPFVSYVGTHPGEEENDPDGLEHAARMDIEKQAIDKIIAIEPNLKRTPEGNQGFDLYETDSDGNTIRWVEVKSMTGTLEDRPVGLSRPQFDDALKHGDAYWLYIVEKAKNPSEARVLRIQGPATLARTFTFDKGWQEIALCEPPVNVK